MRGARMRARLIVALRDSRLGLEPTGQRRRCREAREPSAHRAKRPAGDVAPAKNFQRTYHRALRAARLPLLPPLTHNQGPYDTSLAVIRHEKPLKVRLSRRLIASARRGSPNPSSCTPPTNLGLVGARTARHDREPGGLQVRVGVGLAEEKGHQEAALLAELD